MRTEVINCDIEDGPAGTSSYLVEIPNGGTLILEGNKMQKEIIFLRSCLDLVELGLIDVRVYSVIR